MLEKTEYQFNIISKVKSLREENHLTQTKVCEMLGISKGQLGNIESSKYPHKYTLKQLFTLCQAVNYPIAKLFLTEEQLTSDELVDLLVKQIVLYEN